jgi:hypothetical protein
MATIGAQSNLKNALWKWGGHPQVLKSAKLISLEQELLSLAKAIESPLSSTGKLIFFTILNFYTTTEVDPKQYIDEKWKLRLIEALVTLHFANAQPNEECETIIETISSVPMVSNLLISCTHTGF